MEKDSDLLASLADDGIEEPNRGEPTTPTTPTTPNTPTTPTTTTTPAMPTVAAAPAIIEQPEIVQKTTIEDFLEENKLTDAVAIPAIPHETANKEDPKLDIEMVPKKQELPPVSPKPETPENRANSTDEARVPSPLAQNNDVEAVPPNHVAHQVANIENGQAEEEGTKESQVTKLIAQFQFKSDNIKAMRRSEMEKKND